jgi:hypothetical protein
MLELIASPERFSNRRVVVIGFAHVQGEGSGLYLHKEDFDHGITTNALRLAVPSNGAEAWQSLSGRYVRIEAKFVWGPGDDIASGMLVDITRFEAWPRTKPQ